MELHLAEELDVKRLLLAAVMTGVFGLGSVLVIQPTVAEAHDGDGCCKHCNNSQPCGNSCISFSKTCHQPPGCAC